MTVAGFGMLSGSLVMSATASRRPRLIHVILFELATALCFILMGLKPWMFLVGAAAFGAHFLIAFIQGTTRALLQRQADPAIQGRVFAAWQMATESVRLLAFLTTGLLADRIFEPLLMEHGLLAGTVGRILGTGPGRGVAFMFVLMGAAKLLVSLIYAVRLRSAVKPGSIAEERA